VRTLQALFEERPRPRTLPTGDPNALGSGVKRFGVSRMTLGRALKKLLATGLIVRVQGLGPFSAPLRRVSSKPSICDRQEEVELRGCQQRAWVEHQVAQTAGGGLAISSVLPRAIGFFTHVSFTSKTISHFSPRTASLTRPGRLPGSRSAVRRFQPPAAMAESWHVLLKHSTARSGGPRRKQAGPPRRMIAGDQAFWLALPQPDSLS